MKPSPTHRLAMLGFSLAGSISLFAAGGAQSQPEVQPFKIVQTQPLVFPSRMINEGIVRGEVRLALHVDERGRLADSLVVAYSAREFAESALDTVQRWRFQPTRIGERSYGNVVHLTVLYENNGTVALVRNAITSTEVKPDAPAGTYLFKPCAPNELDRPLRVARAVQPDYPKAIRNRGIGGKVRVNFYVDEQGRPRMAVATPDADPILAPLAIAAVEAWRFEPPTSAGKPVLVSVAQEFSFVAATAGGGSAPGPDGGSAAEE